MKRNDRPGSLLFDEMVILSLRYLLQFFQILAGRAGLKLIVYFENLLNSWMVLFCVNFLAY